MEKKRENFDVVIIGGGSAGLTTAIYCGRAKLKTLVIEKALVGGLITSTDEIENYPGFPEKITGLELMNLFKEQAKKFDVQFKLTSVKSVNLNGKIKEVETFRDIYETKVVVVATGGKPRLTNAQNEEKFLYDKGISFCAVCDAAQNENKTIMVVGSGETAIEEAIFLTKFAKKVMISVRRDKGDLACSSHLRKKALQNEKLEFIWNTEVFAFEGEERLKKVILKNKKTNELQSYDVFTCFLFIGYIPNTELVEGVIELTDNKYIITNEKMETNIKGVYSVGDVRQKVLRQVSTAVGDGAIAGYFIEKYISENF